MLVTKLLLTLMVTSSEAVEGFSAAAFLASAAASIFCGNESKVIIPQIHICICLIFATLTKEILCVFL